MIISMDEKNWTKPTSASFQAQSLTNATQVLAANVPPQG